MITYNFSNIYEKQLIKYIGRLFSIYVNSPLPLYIGITCETLKL